MFLEILAAAGAAGAATAAAGSGPVCCCLGNRPVVEGLASAAADKLVS
jgi:hypothetical protein